MSLATAYKVVGEVSSFSVVLPLIICLIRFKALNITLWALILYLILCFIIDRITSMTLKESTSNILFNCFTIAEFTFVSFTYFQQALLIKFRKIMLILVGLFAFVVIKIFFFEKGITKSDNIVSTIEAGVLIIISSYYSFQLLFNQTLPKLEEYYFYWINFAFLLYFSSATLLFISNNYIENSSENSIYILWGLHRIINIIANLLISIGVWKMKQPLPY